MSCATAPALDELAVLRARVSEQAAEIAHLKLVIAKLRRMQFGRSSEQMDQMLGQLELSLEELETQRAERGEGPLDDTAQAFDEFWRSESSHLVPPDPMVSSAVDAMVAALNLTATQESDRRTPGARWRARSSSLAPRCTGI